MQSTPARRAARRALWLRWHRWIALAFLLPLLLQFLTGLVLVFRVELMRAADGEAFAVTQAAPAASFGEIAAAVRAAYPDRRLLRIDVPRDPAAGWLATLGAPGGGPGLVYAGIDPARPVRVTPLNGTALLLLDLRELHDGWLLGNPGRIAIAISGVALTTLAISGLVLWWPRRLRGAIRFPLRGTVQQLLFLWHRSLGAVVSVLLLVTAVTGTCLALRVWIAPGEPVSRRALPTAIPGDDDGRLQTALDMFPGWILRDVRFDRGGGGIATILLHRAAVPRGPVAQVRLDPATGGVRAVIDPAEQSIGPVAFGWLYPVHTGQWLGLPTRVLQVLVGIAITGLAGSGFTFWLLRQRRRR